MTYSPLTPGTKVSEKEFLRQMELALEADGYVSQGYSVHADSSGYWLSQNGVRVAPSDTDASGILSAINKNLNIR